MTDKQRKYLESLIRKVFRNADSQREILSQLDKVQILSRQASAMIHALRLKCNIRCSVPSYMLVASNLKEATYEKIRWKECGYKPINPERIITRWLYIDDLLPKKGDEE